MAGSMASPIRASTFPEEIQWIDNVENERKAIGEGMKDIDQALEAFHRVLMFAVLLATVSIFFALCPIEMTLD
ncbi:LOW QUALITY PROTEIN: hypothetical protein MKX08_007592 [Trichoderma sp. CBMAI-0020]|nr:LOW QUALITY PROTEIN: hypothetical protein MKX08_007592 [Trichoderma sp. CBMAI-0020]